MKSLSGVFKPQLPRFSSKDYSAGCGYDPSWDGAQRRSAALLDGPWGNDINPPSPFTRPRLRPTLGDLAARLGQIDFGRTTVPDDLLVFYARRRCANLCPKKHHRTARLDG
jgi:hypothetical protein